MKIAAVNITQIIGFNVKGCSSIALEISSGPPAKELSFEDFRIAAILIQIITAAAIINGTTQISIAIPPFSDRMCLYWIIML